MMEWSVASLLDLKEFSFKKIIDYVFPPDGQVRKWSKDAPSWGWTTLTRMIIFPISMACATDFVGFFLCPLHFFTLLVSAPQFIGFRILARVLRKKTRDPVLIDALSPISLFKGFGFLLVVDPVAAFIFNFAK